MGHHILERAQEVPMTLSMVVSELCLSYGSGLQGANIGGGV